MSSSPPSAARDPSARGSELVVRSLTARAGGAPILEDVSFALRAGTRRIENVDGNSTSTTTVAGSIAFVRGPSGGGKTALLRTVASLEPVDENTLLLDGMTPEAWGPAAWRSRVCYVPQSRLRLSGSPADLFAEAAGFAAQADRKRGGLASSSSSSASILDSVASSLLLEPRLMHRPWETLSGGQAARAALAVAMALDPPFLLVDEPTAALDAAAALAVEKALSECGAAVLWVTHDEGQPGRVGGRVYDLVPGVVVVAGGESRGGGGEGDAEGGRENDNGDGGESNNDNDNERTSSPPVVVISPGRLVGGDWAGPKRGRE